ncbi:MAG: hypothetical protein ACW99A_19660 [Candidatus Kariarchaeaceae archaeon]
MTDIREHPHFKYLRNVIYSNDIPHEMFLFTLENTENPEMVVALMKRITEIYAVLKRKHDQLLIDYTLDLGISAFISKNLTELDLLDRIQMDPVNNEIIRIGDEYFVYSADSGKRKLLKAFHYNSNTGYLEPNLSPFPIINLN